MEYVLSLKAGEPNSEFDAWLSRQVDRPVAELREDKYWRFFLDPQPVDEGVPHSHPGKALFTPESLKWYRERWETEKNFAYVEMHFFRDKIKEAVDNGSFALFRRKNDTPAIGFNFDGVTGGLWRAGEVLINANTLIGFDAFDSEDITRVEVAARRRALELSRFMKKYIPGFENAYIVDTGAQTMPRHIRNIQADYTLTEESLNQNEVYDDVVCLAACGHQPGAARQIPYRIMIPKQVENLLVAGKCADGAHLIRSIPSIMNMGHVAGTAAALAAQEDVSPRQLDIKKLQGVLREQSVILGLPQ
jgi:hypothetical protein